MENEIKDTVKRLKLYYLLFWLLPVLLVAAYESDCLPVGVYADNPALQYVWETTGVLAVIALVPLALKFFSIALKKRISNAALPVAIRQYRTSAGLRLILLEVAVLLNVIVYYLTLNNLGLLCAAIGLTASLFCIPGEKQLKEDLNIPLKTDE